MMLKINIVDSILDITQMDTQVDRTKIEMSEELLQSILSASGDAIVVTDIEGKVLLTNISVEKLFGTKQKDLIGKSIEKFFPKSKQSEFSLLLKDFAKNPNAPAKNIDLSAANTDSYEFPMRATISSFNTKEGLRFLNIFRDLSALKNMEVENKKLTIELNQANSLLVNLTNLDQHTQVLNRAGLEQVLAHELNIARREATPLVAALLDLDNFKSLNDNVGHAMGDLAIKGIVERLQSLLRPCDYLGRVGGDSFLVLLPYTELAEGTQITERIREKIAESPLPIAFEDVKLTVSAGIVSLPTDICSLEEVLMLTKIALKVSKAAGKNRVSVSDQHINKNEPTIENDIHKILEAGVGFRTVCHPIYALKNLELKGYELLTRGPSGPLELPNDLFRISRDKEILTVVDLNCLKNCIAQCNTLEDNVRIHVNLFPSTLIDIPAKQLRSLFNAAQKKGQQFCIELSEQQFIAEPSYLQKHVQYLKSTGILIAVDDVGFGRSSLEALILLEPDIIKVDTKYVIGVADDLYKAKALSRLLKIAEALSAELVAEGIENEADLKALLDLGVTYGQGMLWGKPA
jgi:diguanylate cyclase (GGDEF)-like protein/PAS domain S-box-containing protein